MNPLDEYMDAFATAKDAIKVARRTLDGRKNPLGNTGLEGMSAQQAQDALREAEEQLEKLVTFALFATFERELRDHLSCTVGTIGEVPTVPGELASKLKLYLEAAADRWRIDQVIELFGPPVSSSDVSNVKNIRTYRHYVAHGMQPPTSLLPEKAYAQLSAFLKSAGLLQ